MLPVTLKSAVPTATILNITAAVSVVQGRSGEVLQGLAYRETEPPQELRSKYDFGTI